MAKKPMSGGDYAAPKTSPMPAGKPGKGGKQGKGGRGK